MPKPPTIALYWGEDEFLLRQAVLELLSAHDLKATEVGAWEWQGGETSDLATPSLWGERRALLVTECQALPEAGLRELRSYLEAPSPDAVLAMTLVSRARTVPPLGKMVQSAGGLARQVALRRQDLPKWILDRGRARGVRLSGPAAAALIAAVGDDPAALDQGVEQLATAFPGATAGPEQVKAQFQGLGEQRVWDLCDRAFSGQLPEALVVLRSLLDGRDDPLLILGGIASRLRDLIRVQELPARMQPQDAAKAAGLRFDWQVRRYRDQARRYSPEAMAELHEQVTETDRAIKGGAAPEVVLPALIMMMAGARDAVLELPAGPGRRSL